MHYMVSRWVLKISVECNILKSKNISEILTQLNKIMLIKQ